MAQVQTVFERYETKYLLSPSQYAALREKLRGRLREDAYGQYTICNLYYDTPDYRLIRASLEKPVYKEKLRLRSYGVPTADGTAFLEVKKKFRSVVYKRRAAMTLRQAQAYLQSGVRPQAADSQILDEIDWFLGFYRPEPKVFIGYDRAALAGIADSGLRMTFDTNLRWRGTMLDLGRGDWGAPVLTDGSILMEVKLPAAMPLWLARILGGLAAYPTSFSKYGACYQRFLCKNQGGLGGVHCA